MFFFFKQKTAYEMRISDWSSDVCSSDLKVVDATFGDEQEVYVKAKTAQPGEYNLVHSSGLSFYKKWVDSGMSATINPNNIPNLALVMPALMAPYLKMTPDALGAAPYYSRSEEHTSELQSLLRTSFAVFCLTTK